MPLNPGPRYPTVTKAQKVGVVIARNQFVSGFVIGQIIGAVMLTAALLVMSALRLIQ